MSDSLKLHGLQHARLLSPPLSPGVCSDSCPLSWWCYPTISSSVVPFSSGPRYFPSIRVFSSESALHIWWPKYWSFSFSVSPSNEYSGLISFRIDQFDLLDVERNSQESSPAPQFKSLSSSVLSLFMAQLSHLYIPTRKTIALIRWTFVGKGPNVSAF